MTFDEIGRLESKKDVKRKVGGMQDGIRSWTYKSARFIGRNRSQLGSLFRKAPDFKKN